MTKVTPVLYRAIAMRLQLGCNLVAIRIIHPAAMHRKTSVQHWCCQYNECDFRFEVHVIAPESGLDYDQEELVAIL